MSQIFISYKREDRPRAKVIATALIAKGYDVWWDVELLPGQDFYHEINNVIKKAKATIVLWSDLAVESRPVRSEAALADSIGTLIPARIDKVVPPLPFNSQHTIELSEWNNDDNHPEFKSLLQALALKVGPPTGQEKPESIVANEINAAEESWKILWASVRDLQPESLAEYKHFIAKCRKDADDEIIAFAERRILHLSRKKPLDGFRWTIGVAVSALAVIATVLQIQSSIKATKTEPEHETIVETPTAKIEKSNEPNISTDLNFSQDNKAFSEAQLDGRVRAFGKYVLDFPDGIHIQSADRGAWLSATKQNTIAAYDAYQKFFPIGNNVMEAKAKISALENEKNNEFTNEQIEISHNNHAVGIPPNEFGQDYTVKRGDTLYRIAKKNCMTIDRIKTLNNGILGNTLTLGQTLRVTPSEQCDIYAVLPGNTLEWISENSCIPINTIKSMNFLGDQPLTPGKPIVLPKDNCLK